MKREIWKSIKDFEGYMISNLGRIKSFKKHNEYILKLGLDSSGYLKVNLVTGKKVKTKNVHQLVAIAFLNHVPNGHKLVVNHKNFIRTDNRSENLEIISARENSNLKHLKHSSNYTGVHFLKSSNKYQSYIIVNKNKKHLGTFKNEFSAHLAYENELKKISN